MTAVITASVISRSSTRLLGCKSVILILDIFLSLIFSKFKQNFRLIYQPTHQPKVIKSNVYKFFKKTLGVIQNIKLRIYLCHCQQECRPSSGNFAYGEFAQLFQKSLEALDLIFRNGIDWDASAYSFKEVEVENQGAQLDAILTVKNDFSISDQSGRKIQANTTVNGSKITSALPHNLIAIAGSHPDELSLAFNVVSTCRVN